jgi:ADP-ribose pyrophosphatase
METSMTQDRVEVIAKETVFDGYFRIDRYRLKHELHAGGWSGELVREVFERGHAVAVLPFDPARETVVLIEQFRVGAFAHGDGGWIMESVAGIIEPGETPEDVARRETHEETGLAVHDLVPIADFYVSPGGTSQFNNLFCAIVDADRAGGIHGLDHEGEDIRVVPVPLAEVSALIASGAIRDATTLIALQWLLAHHETLHVAAQGGA